jgi:hypothetical protein
MAAIPTERKNPPSRRKGADPSLSSAGIIKDDDSPQHCRGIAATEVEPQTTAGPTKREPT